MRIDEHIVRYDLWCHKCKHKKVESTDSPCTECLDEPVNTNTNQPVLFEEDKK